ncbi:uncharacterized protein LOC109594694 isoform X2 [Aethina tumida]|uniref:uncharacterized protein LOC109594694 isoform X2 n=1 Tax=Aethina tumida TaxID=116153 RepID=UPI0021480561|nr:uncharacterized protein LOC109594694 isoform X2 [Aethina tumida]
MYLIARLHKSDLFKTNNRNKYDLSHALDEFAVVVQSIGKAETCSAGIADVLERYEYKENLAQYLFHTPDVFVMIIRKVASTIIEANDLTNDNLVNICNALKLLKIIVSCDALDFAFVEDSSLACLNRLLLLKPVNENQWLIHGHALYVTNLLLRNHSEKVAKLFLKNNFFNTIMHMLKSGNTDDIYIGAKSLFLLLTCPWAINFLFDLRERIIRIIEALNDSVKTFEFCDQHLVANVANGVATVVRCYEAMIYDSRTSTLIAEMMPDVVVGETFKTTLTYSNEGAPFYPFTLHNLCILDLD